MFACRDPSHLLLQFVDAPAEQHKGVVLALHLSKAPALTHSKSSVRSVVAQTTADTLKHSRQVGAGGASTKQAQFKAPALTHRQGSIRSVVAQTTAQSQSGASIYNSGTVDKQIAAKQARLKVPMLMHCVPDRHQEHQPLQVHNSREAKMDWHDRHCYCYSKQTTQHPQPADAVPAS